MSGAAWAVVAGLGFGVFQTLNRRAVTGMNVFVATFIQLLVSALVMIGVTLATEDISVLFKAPLSAIVWFALAGVIHFSIGWTFLNASQKRIGAARTGALIGTTPLFGALIAFITLSEGLDIFGIMGILLIVAGAYVTSNPFNAGRDKTAASPDSSRWRSLALAMAAPLCWSISPILIKYGLQDLASPLLGVTVGLSASALGYGLALAVHHVRSPLARVGGEALALKIVAGVLVGLSTWARWVALDMTTVAAVLALSMVSVPTVNLLTPLVIGRHLERVTRGVWFGSALIIAGSLVLILT
jgi:drug/metabolite transporter (DMT)-like permease